MHNWDFIKASENPDEFRKHLALYPDGTTARYARTALEKAAWKMLGGDPTLDQMRAFLVEFPDGHYARRAAELRDGLLAKFAEEVRAFEELTAWNAALAANTAESYRKFIDIFPASAHRAEARAAIEHIEEDQRSADARRRETGA
jgi:hypothetical protein